MLSFLCALSDLAEHAYLQLHYPPPVLLAILRVLAEARMCSELLRTRLSVVVLRLGRVLARVLVR